MNIYKSEIFQDRTLLEEASYWVHKADGTIERESISAYSNASTSSILIVEWSADGRDASLESWEVTSFRAHKVFNKAHLAANIAARVPGEQWEHEPWRIEFLEGLKPPQTCLLYTSPSPRD